MLTKEELDNRLAELGWTLYRLAKEFAALRSVNGEVSPATRYHSAIGKAFERLGSSKLATVADIVTVMGGEISVNWQPINTLHKPPRSREPAHIVRLLSQAKFCGLTYSDSFFDALECALEHYSSSATASAEIYTDSDECCNLICTADEIVQLVTAQPTERQQYSIDSDGYIVIKEVASNRVYSF